MQVRSREHNEEEHCQDSYPPPEFEASMHNGNMEYSRTDGNRVSMDTSASGNRKSWAQETPRKSGNGGSMPNNVKVERLPPSRIDDSRKFSSHFAQDATREERYGKNVGSFPNVPSESGGRSGRPINVAHKYGGRSSNIKAHDERNEAKPEITDPGRFWLDLNEVPRDASRDSRNVRRSFADGPSSDNHYHSRGPVRPGFRLEGKQFEKDRDATASVVEQSRLLAAGEEVGAQAVLPVKRKLTQEFPDEALQHSPRGREDNSVHGPRESRLISFSHSHSKRNWNGNEESSKSRLHSVQHEPEEKIVWPPVVIIENTRVGWDPATNKWKGLENEEIRIFLKGVKDCEFGRVLALYGMKGHRGKALVIFRSDYLGFTDAQALSECLQRDNKGREHWEKVSHGLSLSSMDGWYSKDLVTDDGKRILYGYLAREEDMINADPHRKAVKRWSMESYAEKILEPMKRTEKGKEEARKKIEELTEEAKNKLVAVEHNKSEFGKKVEELKKVDGERQLRKKHEEELEAQHRRDFEARKRRYEEDKMKRFAQFREQENKIRTCLQNHKAQKEREMAHYVGLAQKLKDEIDGEKKKHEVRLAELKQMETMKQMELQSGLQVVMENRLTLLDSSFKEKQLKLQQQHNEEIMKSRKKIEAEREELLQSKITELHAIENEIQVAKDATEQMHKEAEEKNNECIVCYSEFGTEISERAFYFSCNHANVCKQCAGNLWKSQISKKEKPSCPTCKTEQTKKYSTLPGRFYL